MTDDKSIERLSKLCNFWMKKLLYLVGLLLDFIVEVLHFLLHFLMSRFDVRNVSFMRVNLFLQTLIDALKLVNSFL